MDRLLALQALDLDIDRLRARQRELEAGEELAAARSAVEEAEGRLGELRLALDAVGREVARMEHEVDALTRKAEAEERRLYDGSVGSAKELEAIRHEVENLKGRRSRAEDELLDQMVRREDLEARVAEAERALAVAMERLEAVGGQAAGELARVAAELAERLAAREALALEIDDELLALYEELRAQKKGVGAAALVGGVCQGCHQKLSAMELDRVKHAPGVARCEYCRRILIFA